MRRIACLALCGFVLSCPVLIRQGGLDHLSGSVVSENGTPIQGVKIYAWLDATTDAEGRFDLPNTSHKDALIFFQKEGFRPKTLIVRTQTSTVKVTLEDDRKTAWYIPSCLAGNANTSPDGYELRFRLPENATLRKLKDIDYQAYLVSFKSDRQPLELWWGPLVMGGRSIQDLMLGSASFEERSIHSNSGEIIGYDQRGSTRDGLSWRSADFSALFGSAKYQGISEEATLAYDRVIDSACQLRQSH